MNPPTGHVHNMRARCVRECDMNWIQNRRSAPNETTCLKACPVQENGSRYTWWDEPEAKQIWINKLIRVIRRLSELAQNGHENLKRNYKNTTNASDFMICISDVHVTCLLRSRTDITKITRDSELKVRLLIRESARRSDCTGDANDNALVRSHPVVLCIACTAITAVDMLVCLLWSICFPKSVHVVLAVIQMIPTPNFSMLFLWYVDVLMTVQWPSLHELLFMA